MWYPGALHRGVFGCMRTDSLWAAAGPRAFRGIRRCPCTENMFSISREMQRALKSKPEDILQQQEGRYPQWTSCLGSFPHLKESELVKPDDFAGISISIRKIGHKGNFRQALVDSRWCGWFTVTYLDSTRTRGSQAWMEPSDAAVWCISNINMGNEMLYKGLACLWASRLLPVTKTNISFLFHLRKLI